MISVGNRDANKGLGLGLGLVGGGREMEETELEEGEACSYNNDNDDYDGSIDPDIALSYIDEKLQDVLGHFQKDFEGGVSAENLGSKFGGYGSFLPTYQRSPVWSHPRTPPKVQNNTVPRSPNNMQSEGGCRNTTVSSTAPQPLRPGPASGVTSLPASKASSNYDSVKEEVSMPFSRTEEYTSRHVTVNKKNLSDQKTLKVRIKVGSDNLSTQKNAAIYSGLGLYVSPSSSPDDSPSESEGMDRDPLDALLESPMNILRIMTCFSVPGDLLLSPLPDFMFHLTEKEKLLKDGRSMPFPRGGLERARISVNGSDAGKGDGKVTGERKSKSVEKNDFSSEFKSGNNRDAHSGFSVLPKKEVDVDTLACEELVTETLKLPLLSNSYSHVDDLTKGKGRASDPSREASKSAMRDTVFSVAKEEPLEPMYAQETGWDDNQKVGSAGKIWEDKKASSIDDVSVYPRKDSYKREKNSDSVKADSDVIARKALKTELADPPKQKHKHRVTPHELDGMKLAPRKEHRSSSAKKKSKGSQSHGGETAEVPKDSLKVVSTSVPKSKKNTHADNYSSKRETEEKLQKDIVKAEDKYREFFGDIEESEKEENRMSLLEMHSEDKPKDYEVVEKNTSAVNNASKERSSSKKIEKFLTPEACPKAAPPPGDGPASQATQATTAPVVIQENWVCCDKCQKWRLLPLVTNPDSLPEKWLCSMITWLPGMNRCSVGEEETTKAFMALYHVPVLESQNNLHVNPPGVISRVNLADVRHPDQNNENYGSRFLPHGGKKKHGLKEVSSATNKDGPAQLSNSMKKNIQASVRSGSLNDVSQSPVISEQDFRQLSKSSDLPEEKHKYKHKEKHKVLDHNSDGGETKSSKMKSKRESDQESFRASKKLKAESLNFADEDWTPDRGGAPGKGGPSLSNGLPTTSVGKDRIRYSDHYSKDSKSDTKDRSQVSAKKLKDKVKVSSDDAAARKRKMKDGHDIESLPGTGNHLQGSRNFMEEFSENDYRKEKKARVSKSEGKESSVSKGNSKGDKKGGHAKNKQQGQDLGSTLSQRSLDGMDSKRDSGPVQPSVAATSSSSKVSGSHKNKASFHEAKGSPVESVSSSPMRISNSDKGTSARRNLSGKNESHDAEFLAVGSPRRCSYGEDGGGSDRSGTARKEKTTVAQHGSLESSVLDIQDKNLSGGKAKVRIVPSPDITNQPFSNGIADYLGQDSQHPRKQTTLDEFHDEERQNDNCYHVNGARPRKSGKGSSSRSKDKNRSLKSDSVFELQGNVPSRDSRNKFQEKSVVKSDDNEKRYDDKKDSAGKLSSESCKRESQSTLGGHDGPDAKVDVISSQDTTSISKQNLQDCNGERSSKTSTSDRTDQVELALGRGKSQSLPPSGGVQNETLVRFPRVASGSHKGNASDVLAADGSQVDDATKVPKHSRKPDHQNGSQHISSRHPSQNGHKTRDLDAPSPARKDSSSQAATNAVKEAKDLKHLADRLKNSGSNHESTGLYFEAALKFLHGASLLESSSSETAKHGEMIQSMQMYSSTAKLCEFCAHEFEKSKNMAGAALAYKLTEVAYMRVIYSSHNSASRDRHELQTALQMIPPGESPSSSASDVDNVNQPITVDKAALPKGVSSPQVAGNHVIAARNRPNFNRLLNFVQDVNFAMEASRKSQNAFAVANVSMGETQHREGISSIKRALDFNFQDVEGLLRLRLHSNLDANNVNRAKEMAVSGSILQLVSPELPFLVSGYLCT
ncbi:hypothetical protein LWI28_023832 [Acer negundo]|uniref:CW-type domain-containing protein n=1 Tax=Acer negundo TaxID=4023 RepID=A0AAD5J0V2_ACENE|nr:hypothetical protein LWI28_023832 [Acer negundo]